MSMIGNLTLELENLLNDCECNYGRGLDIRIDGDMIKTLREAISTIKELSAKLHAASMERSSQYYNGGWIPTDERLPETYDDVLVCVSGRPRPNIACTNAICIASYCKTEGWILDAYPKWKTPKVIAWMPLPEP